MATIYLGVLFMSAGQMKRLAKRRISDLLVNLVPTLTYGHDIWSHSGQKVNELP